MLARIQKILSDAGVASRRQAEKWITEGRVTCNGRICVLGQSADPDTDCICVDGKQILNKQEYVYLMLQKTDLCESNIQMAARLIENESYTPLIKEQKQEELRKLTLLLQDTEHCNLTLSRIIIHNKSKFFNL